MSQKLRSFVEEALKSIEAAGENRAALERLKAEWLGRKGKIREWEVRLKRAKAEERPALGQALNAAKQALMQAFKAAFQALASQALVEEMGEAVDVSLPPPDGALGVAHPISQLAQTLTAILRPLGFVATDGLEVETEWYCFDALNTPADHPARDVRDTFFFPKNFRTKTTVPHGGSASERYILRTHTSCTQIRALEELKGVFKPLRMMSMGRVFRRDTVDATHSVNFHQLEGLCVDKQVSLADLKAILLHLTRCLFGDTVAMRLRPSFFPFTTPSFEIDIQSEHLGKLSGQWIEVLGCGLVHPAVFRRVGLPEDTRGYAFGLGLERLAMILHGLDDLRHLYQNSLRFLRQFA